MMTLFKHPLPTFPAFVRLDVSHKKLIDSFFAEFRPYSDYNFTSMLCYDTEDSIRLSRLHGNLVVQFSDYLTGSPFYSFLGKNKIIETAQQLIDFSKEKLGKNFIGLIGEEIIQAEVDLYRFFHIQESRDQFDYIINLLHLSKLDGGIFKSKRQHVSRFLREYPNSEIKVIDLTSEKVQTEILYLIFKWARFGTEYQKDFDHELIAIRRVTHYQEYFNLFCTGIYNEGRLICFSINELLNFPYAICHFMKADPNYPSAFNALDNFTAKNLVEKDYKYLNIEQDLGLSGLRSAKLSLHPEFMLKKYTIQEK